MKLIITTTALVALAACTPPPICPDVYVGEKLNGSPQVCEDRKPLFGLSQGLGNDRDRSGTPASNSTGTPDYTLGEPRGIAPEQRARDEYEGFAEKVSDNPPLQDVEITAPDDVTITVDDDGNVDISTPGDLTIEVSDGDTGLSDAEKARKRANEAIRDERERERDIRRARAAQNQADRAMRQMNGSTGD